MVFLSESKEKNIEEPVLSVIKERRSIRKYTTGFISEDKINKILEAGTWAPSAGNYQPWEFVLITDREVKDALIEASYNQEWMREAAFFIVVCVNNHVARAIYGDRGEKLYSLQSIGAAIQNMLLAAHAMGLGACWVGAFSEVKVSSILQLPDYVRPTAIITIGIPANKPEPPHRVPFHEVLHRNKF